MSLNQLKIRLSELNFQGMMAHLEEVISKHQKGELHITEAIDLLLEEEWRYRSHRATEARTRRSKIRKGATLEEFDFSFPRGITKSELKELSKLSWCEPDRGQPLILIGPTGAGKTYLARAFGLLACEKGKQSMFMSVTDFLEHQAHARSQQTYLRFRQTLTRPDLLILDDFGTRKFTAQEAEDLRDIIEHRSYGKATVITTQLTLEHWGSVIGDKIILDALIDRLESPGQIISLKGERSFREKPKKSVEKLTQKH